MYDIWTVSLSFVLSEVQSLFNVNDKILIWWQVKKAYLILTNRELTKGEVEKALDGIKDLATSSSSDDATEPSASEESSVPHVNSDGHNCNGVNGTKLNFDQFCCIMSELIHHRYRNSIRHNSGLPAGKTEYFVENVSAVLTRLLGWL